MIAMMRSEARFSPNSDPMTGKSTTEPAEMMSAQIETGRAPRTAINPPIIGAVKITENPLMPRTTPAFAEDPVVSRTSHGIAI
jgi:hypothetical protein